LAVCTISIGQASALSVSHTQRVMNCLKVPPRLGFGRSAVGMEFGLVLLSPRERSGEGIKTHALIPAEWLMAGGGCNVMFGKSVESAISALRPFSGPTRWAS